MSKIIKEIERCGWCLKTPLYIRYHDKEWGVPVKNDRKQFEFLVLESAQAGLSWLTILNKREGYKKAFADFDVEKVARFSKKKIETLLTFEGIVRNRLKVESTVSNARHFIEIQEEYGSFAKYIWGFVDGKPMNNKRKSLKDIPPTSDISDKLSKDMKQRGFKFLGSTVIYAHMQATGFSKWYRVPSPSNFFFRSPNGTGYPLQATSSSNLRLESVPTSHRGPVYLRCEGGCPHGQKPQMLHKRPHIPVHLPHY